MKRLVFFLLLILLAFACVSSVNAYSFKVDGICYDITSSEGLACAVTYEKYENGTFVSSYSGNVVIPSAVAYEGQVYSVTSIGVSAFRECRALASVTIPGSVTEICNYAFADCVGLAGITIPEGVTSIGASAFAGCSGLVSVTMPSSVTSIGSLAFAECNGLTGITIPNNVESIGVWAFRGCCSITGIVLPDKMTSIDAFVFQGCSGLTSLTIPSSVTSIGQGAFYDCGGLASVKIPNSVTEIGSSAFYGCTGLRAVHAEDLSAWCSIKFREASSNPLYYAHNLYLNGVLVTSLEIPSDVTSIGDYAFYDCSSLTGITVQSGVASIGRSAFANCSSLTDINIPGCVTSIGDYAFQYCRKVARVFIAEGVVSIGRCAFDGCSALERIVIPNGVTAIGECAFDGCSALERIVIPNGVTAIGECAFQNCSALASISIGNSVRTIGYCAFANCHKLQDIQISDLEAWMKIRYDSGNAFTVPYSIHLNGLRLIDLVIPESVTVVPMYCFFGCESLESITIHKDVTAIVQNAFNACSNVRTITCLGTTPPQCGAMALDGISRTECTLHVPEESAATYRNTPPWNEFMNIAGGSADTPSIPSTCEVPVISIVDGQLCIESPTHGSECQYTIRCDDEGFGSVPKNTLIPLSGQYTITAYAKAEGMYNSGIVTAVLAWVAPVLRDNDNVLPMPPHKAVVIKSDGNRLLVCGTEHGESISLYTVSGLLLHSATANDGETAIPCPLHKGETYIVEYAGKTIKYRH